MSGRAAAALAVLALTLPACDRTGGSFFRPFAEGDADATPPVFSKPSPAPDIEVLSADRITIEVTDPGEGTGVDPGSIEASVAGGAPLIAIVELPAITIDLGSAPDGRLLVVVVAQDRAGNQSTHIFDFVLDRTPPPLAFVAVPPAALAVSQVTLIAPVQVQVGAEPHFDTGQIRVRTPSADGICGTADDGAVPTEVLAEPERPLLGPGLHSVTFVLNNPVPSGGASTTAVYCWVATATDSARGPDGETEVNRTTIAARSDVFWLPPP